MVADASGGQWSVAVQHLTKAGVVNVEKPRVGTLVACYLRELYLPALPFLLKQTNK